MAGNDKPPNNVIHGAIRYIRSQSHLIGRKKPSAPRGGRDDVGSIENELWRGRAERMRQMHSGSGRSEVGRTDERVRRDANEHLTVHERIDATEVEVDVKDGVVTLTGIVRTREERRLCEDEVYAVRGVVDVINQLRVPPPAVAPPEANATR